MASIPTTRRVFVVLNPAAGRAATDALKTALTRHFAAPGEVAETCCEVHETCHGEAVPDVVREALGRGYDLVVAAGGDGTVSAVANGLVGSETPLGIVPLGTANVLARELGIPVDLEPACRLLAGPHAVKSLDAMGIDGHCYFTQTGVGIDALMIRDTKREAKRRFGRVAYLWTACTRLVGFQPLRFDLSVDGRNTRYRASEVVVANCGILGQPPFRWGPDILPDDGRLDVCIARARHLVDYLRIAWHVVLGQHKRSPNVRYLSAERRIEIATRRPLPVQADGEIIGETPVAVEVVRDAVRVAVPVSADHP